MLSHAGFATVPITEAGRVHTYRLVQVALQHVAAALHPMVQYGVAKAVPIGEAQ